MQHMLNAVFLCVTLVTLVVSTPVGPSHYGGPHGSNSVHRGGPHGGHRNFGGPGGNFHQGGPQRSAYGHSQNFGREMKYTVRDPHNRGTTHVTETHVVSNRQMHGAEAEAAMKRLMGSMGSGHGGPGGPGGRGGFHDFVKDMGLPFY